jgi:hypothetical protein
MTTHVTTHNPVRSDVAGARASAAEPTTSRSWAYAGVGSGLAAIVGIVASGRVGSVYDESLFGNPEGIAADLADKTLTIAAFHSATLVCAVLLVVFAAGLQRLLRKRLGSDSLAPAVAFAGLVGTAVVSVIGTGLDTEFIAATDKPFIDPSNAAMFNHWIGTVPWCWVLVGLSALAVHVAGRAGAVPRWIGRTSLVLGGITLVAGVSPLQYLAGLTGPLWLLAVAIGFAREAKAERSGR